MAMATTLRQTNDGKFEVGGGYIFDTEQRARAYCEMVDAHWQMMDYIKTLPAQLSRAEYERLCNEHGIAPREEAKCFPSSPRGEYFPWLDNDDKVDGYPPLKVLEIYLSQKRGDAIKAAAPPKPVRAVARNYPNGRVLDCGCVVYYSSHVMSSSRGSSCIDCYDRMSE